MKEPVGIDSVYAELIKLEDENYVYGLSGYQFYMSSKTADNKNNFFLWKMIETYQYTSIHELYAIYNNGRLYFSNYHLFDEYKNRYICWMTENVNIILTGKTSNLLIPRISNQPLHFVGTDTWKLQERYSLLLKQYSISEEAYYFWKGIEDQISEENFLVAYQPYNIIGNVRNINNPKEEVFGNFTVASVTEKRIFLDSPRTAFYYITKCSINYDYTRVRPPVFVIIGYEGELGSVKEGCIDCTYFGGSVTKPDFWIDK